MNIPRWQFAPTFGGTEDGINNPMIEHFEGNYNYHLAREIIQNSIDARKDKLKPVTVNYSLEFFNQSDFPGQEKLVDVICECLNYYDEDDKAQKLLSVALDTIRMDKIPVLKISDFNTNGLDGNDSDKKLPWYNLVKSRGSSSKSGGEGGSFGLGKGAPYAASNLRTIFYSTKSDRDGKSRFIGVSELVSHIDEGTKKRGVGSYAYSEQSTIMNPEDMLSFWRRETGLDIYIMGFKNNNTWKNDLVKSVLRNFWYALLNEDLIVKIDDIEISFSSIQDLMSQHFLDEPYRDYIKPLGNPLYYLDSVMNTGKEFKTNLKTIGDVRFYFKQIEERLNYVAMMRSSHMVIYSKNFHFPAPFSGVFICDDKNGNEELRKMESPTHDIWDPARYPENGRKIMDEVEEWIRSCLRELRQSREDEILEIPDLYKLLPYEDGDESGNGQGNQQYTGNESVEESSNQINESLLCRLKAKIDPYSVKIFNEEEAGWSGGKKLIRKGKGRIKKGAGAAGGKGKNRTLSESEFETRVFGTSKNYQTQEYNMIVKSHLDGRCDLKISGMGEEGNEKIKVLNVVDPRGHKYKLVNNYIKGFYLEKNSETKLKIKIDSKIKCSLSIAAYEIQ